MGFHLMGALFLTGIASLIAADKKKGLLLCGAAVVTMTLMALDFFLFRGGTGGLGQKFTFDLFHAFRGSLARVGITHLPWFSYPHVSCLYSATFGARVFGFVFVKRAFSKTYFNPFLFFLAVFTISGFFLSEVISIGHPGSQKNNAIWFLSQSLFCAWLLVAYFLIEQIKHWKRLLAFVVIIMLFSMPSTVQFLALRYDPAYAYFDANALEVAGYLENTPPKSKVLHPLNDEPSLASNFAGRASVINTFRSFAPFYIRDEEYLRRISDVKSFFSADSLMKRPLLLKHYDVDFVYAPIAYLPLLKKEAMLSQVLKNDEYVVYKVQRTGF
jgi:hypothetical protein